jgi:hypothetical protein
MLVQDAEGEEPMKEPECSDIIQVQQQQQPNPKRCKPSSTPMKQKKMLEFLGKTTVNEEHIARIESQRKSVHDLDIELECAVVLEKLINSLEIREKSLKTKSVNFAKQRKSELTWASRSVIIYFFLHPILGKNDYERTAALFRISARTLEGWITKAEMKRRWGSLVNELRFDDVVGSIPDLTLRQKLQGMQINPKLKQLSIPFQVSKGLKIMSKNSCDSRTHQATLSIANATKALYVRQNDKRIGNKRQSSTRKYVEVQDFIARTIIDRWNMGMPLSKEELRRLVLMKSKEQNWYEWRETYGQGSSQTIRKLTVFLDRAIRKIGFSIRKNTVSQKIPEDWRRLSELGAQRVRNYFKDARVDVVLAADETFIRFHESRGLLIAPSGEKRVGTAAQIDDKAGCTVLPTMDMTASQLLTPMVIFTGVFGATLMKKWQTYAQSLVMFTEKHWMTAETFILYVSWLMDYYKGKRIGLIIDYAPSHCNAEVSSWINRLNKEHAVHETKIFIEWVDKGLTSVYQPGDIAINKPLKDKIRESYHEHVSAIASKNFQAGQRIRVSREILLGFIEKAFRSINRDQKCSSSIYKSFRMCGLNPWDDTLEHFRAHLDSLSQNSLYATLLKNQEALQL